MTQLSSLLSGQYQGAVGASGPAGTSGVNGASGATGSQGLTGASGADGGGGGTTQYSIGSYILGRPLNTDVYDNATIAGSSLYAMGPNTRIARQQEDGHGIFEYQGFNNTSSVNTGTGTYNVGVGSWRCVSVSDKGYSDLPQANWGGFPDFGYPGLWVRYA